MQVKFSKLVDIDLQVADRELQGGAADPYTLLKKLPNVAVFHQHIGEYFEVQGHRWREVSSHFPSASELEIVEGTPPFHRSSLLKFSRDMMDQYPVINFGRTIFLSEDTFRVVHSGLDDAYFLIREYNFT